MEKAKKDLPRARQIWRSRRKTLSRTMGGGTGQGRLRNTITERTRKLESPCRGRIQRTEMMEMIQVQELGPLKTEQKW